MSAQVDLFAIVQGSDGPRWFDDREAAVGELGDETYLLYEGPTDLTRLQQ